jgi:hypothetical protein
MVTVADSKDLREILDRFVAAYVVSQEQISAARVLKDDAGSFISVAVEPNQPADVPGEFEGLRVILSEREPGHVAAGPLR